MSASTQKAAVDISEPAPSSVDILVAITACKESLAVKMDYLAADISLIGQELDKFCSRVSEVEDHVSTVEDMVRADNKDLHM